MGITQQGLDIIAANMTGSGLVTATAVGSGDTAFAVSQTALVSETDRNAFSTSDLSVGSEVTFTTDWSVTDISGTILKEHATFTTGSIMLNREVLTGSLVFDGEQELQIQYTLKFFA